MFHVTRLFGEAAHPQAVLGHASFLERARAEREHDREIPSRLALAAYLVARLTDRLFALNGTDEDRDGFEWQHQSTRRYLGELPADTAESAHLAGILDAVEPVKAGGPTGMLRVSLSAYAFFLEQEGRLEEALDIVTLQARSYGADIPVREFVSTALVTGRLNRLLARWDEANTAYRAAHEAAASTGDDTSRFISRLGQANVLRGQGDLPKARAEVEAVLAEATAAGNIDVQARAYADLGVVYERMGSREDSLAAMYQSFVRTEDVLQQMRMLGDIGIVLAQLGTYDVARTAFEIVIASRASLLVRVNAHLELMDIESAVGNRFAFERHRQDSKEFAAMMPPSMAIDYRYKVGTGLRRFGQLGRARQQLFEALALAEEHGLNQWYFRVERELAELEQGRGAAAASPVPAGVPYTPAVAQVASQLRELALATAG